VWSVTSFTELRREGLEVERWNMLHPEQEPQISYVERQLGGERKLGIEAGPVVAASDYMASFADQIRPFVKASYRVLGTDGYGRSDTREKLRRHFEVDRNYVAVAALAALAGDAAVEPSRVTEAIHKYGVDPEKPNAAGL
jgi:pyruvate dehydrogenase E1 component